MERLPAELWDNVVGRLGREEKRSWRRVCRAARLQADETLINALIRCSTGYERLHTYGRRFPNLQAVKMARDHASFYSPRNIDVKAVASCRGLQELSISDCQAVTDISPLSKLVQLTRLELHASLNLSDAAMQTLARLPRLEVLHVSGCSYVTDFGLNHLRRCSALRDFKLSNVTMSYMGDAGLHGLLAAVPVSRLNLTDVPFTPAALAGAVSVKELAITDVEAFVASDAAMEAVAALPALEKLLLVGLEVSDNGIAILTGSSAALHSIEVRCCADCMSLLFIRRSAAS